MPALFSNNATATLAGPLESWHTSLVLTEGDGALFPSPDSARGEYFSATISNSTDALEIVKVLVKTGDTLMVSRGQQGTTARSFAKGDRVELRLTSAELAAFVQRGEIQAEDASRLKNVWHVAATAMEDHADSAARGSLAWVLAQVGSAPAQVRLPGGNVYGIGRDLTVPDNVTLVADRGAILNVATGMTLTLMGELDAGAQLLFTGFGRVTGAFGGLPVLPQWWGARGDGATDDSAALQLALTFPAVRLPIGTYLVSIPLDLTQHSFVRGDGGTTGFIDWTKDFEKLSPSYAGRAAVIQFKPGAHGALFNAMNNVRFDGLVFRCGQVRNGLDRFMNGAPSHLSFRSCRFENLDTVLGSGTSYGAMHMEDCSFFGCGAGLSGAMVDSRIIGCVFTSCNYAVDLGAGSGLNVIQGCRLEWGKVGFRCFEGRSNVLMGNILDAHEETAVCLNRAKNHVLSGNIFWRNGRNGSDAEKRSHIVLRETAQDNAIVGNTFLKGGPDGGQDQWPRYIVETVSVVSGRNAFRDNQHINGCMEMPFNDAYWTSSEALSTDDVHIKGLGNPGQSNDQLIDILKRIALLADGPVNVHLYENRSFTIYTDLAYGKIRLVGHGNVSLTDTTGRAQNLLGIQNISYGVPYHGIISTSTADGPPTAGWWGRGSLIWNANPMAGQPVGWACTASGAPGSWSGFGVLA